MLDHEVFKLQKTMKMQKNQYRLYKISSSTVDRIIEHIIVPDIKKSLLL